VLSFGLGIQLLLKMDFRRALVGGGRRFNQERRFYRKQQNPYSNPDWPLEVVNVKTDNFTRELDFTLSLGRRCRGTMEIANLLKDSGAVTEDNFQQHVEQIGINNGNVENGQIVVHCKSVESVDRMVNALNEMGNEEIRNCHSYKSYETPVTLAYIHPKADIQKDVIEKILNKTGEVLHYHAQIHPTLKIKTGAYIFIMYTKDLDKRPLPLRANLNGFSTSISYSGRQEFCFGCGNKGHIKRNCPKPEGPQQCWHCHEIGHIQANCPQLLGHDPKGKDENGETSEIDFSQMPRLEGDDPPTAAPNVFLNGIRPEDDKSQPGTSGTASAAHQSVFEIQSDDEMEGFDEELVNKFPGTTKQEKVQALKAALERIPIQTRLKNLKKRGRKPTSSHSDSESLSKKASKETVVKPPPNIVDTQTMDVVIRNLDLVSQAAHLSQIGNNTKPWHDDGDPEG